MNNLIEKTASFYRLCSILTPMEKLADSSTDNIDTPESDTGDSRDPAVNAGATEQIAFNSMHNTKQPDVIKAKPSMDLRTYPTATTQG